MLAAGEGGLDAEDLRGDGVVVDGGGAMGAAETGDAASPIGERWGRPGEGGCSLLRRREHGVEAVRDGVPVRAEAVGAVGGGDPDGGIDGVEDASARAAEEAPPIVQRRRRHRNPRPPATRPPIRKKKGPFPLNSFCFKIDPGKISTSS